MDVGAYHRKLEGLRPLSLVNLVELGRWTDADALPWLWAELSAMILPVRTPHPMARKSPTQQVLRPMGHTEAVRQGLIASVPERRRVKEASYYRAQLTMLDSEAHRYCKVVLNVANNRPPTYEDAIVFTLQRALWDIVHAATALLEDAAREFAQTPGRYGHWRRPHERSFEVFKGAEQIVYGTFSGLTHADRAPYTPVAVLRTAIELRLRHAFGVHGLTNPGDPDVLVPVDLSKLFEALKVHQKQIDFEVDLHDVWRIYRWSNFYLHAGRRDFPWVPGFLLQYLRPLFVGQLGGRNIDGGIRMKREVWHSLRLELQPKRRPFLQRLRRAWNEIFSSTKKTLVLEGVDPNQAQCEFLD